MTVTAEIFSQELIMSQTEAYEDQWEGEARGFADDCHPAYLPASNLLWKAGPEFALGRLCHFLNDKAWLQSTQTEALTENDSIDSQRCVRELEEAIKDRSIDPIIAVEGTDGSFYLWDGSHRTSVRYGTQSVHAPRVGWLPKKPAINRAYLAFICRRSIHENLSPNGVKVTGLLFRSPAEKNHDYGPNWDHVVNEEPDPKLANLATSACHSMYRDLRSSGIIDEWMVGFEGVGCGASPEVVATYVSGTYDFPVILIS